MSTCAPDMQQRVTLYDLENNIGRNDRREYIYVGNSAVKFEIIADGYFEAGVYPMRDTDEAHYYIIEPFDAVVNFDQKCFDMKNEAIIKDGEPAPRYCNVGEIGGHKIYVKLVILEPDMPRRESILRVMGVSLRPNLRSLGDNVLCVSLSSEKPFWVVPLTELYPDRHLVVR